MAWTYSDSVATAKDKVRFRIGDTINADPQLTDGEINYLLTSASNDVLEASRQACLAIAAKYARQVTKSMGQTSIQLTQRKAHYTEMAAQIEQEIADNSGGTGAPVFASGTTPEYVMPGIEDYDLVAFADPSTE